MQFLCGLSKFWFFLFIEICYRANQGTESTYIQVNARNDNMVNKIDVHTAQTLHRYIYEKENLLNSLFHIIPLLGFFRSKVKYDHAIQQQKHHTLTKIYRQFSLLKMQL